MATLRDLRIRLMFRLGQITNGTWGKEIYFEDTPEETEVDEYKMVLNESQVTVLRDIYTHQFVPFKRLNEVIPIVPNQTQYTLPQEFLQPVSIYHHKPKRTPIPLDEKILDNYRSLHHVEDESSVSTNEYFEYYEVSGMTGLILGQGQVTWVDEDTTQEQFTSEYVNLTNVREGDLVTNITDGSQGVITQFGSGIATIGNGLFGGRSNRFQIGDEFVIHSREETRFVLETWPPINFESPKQKYTIVNTDNNKLLLSPNQDSIIETVRLQLKKAVFDDILTNYNPQDRLLLYIINDTKSEHVDILGFQKAMVGWNELDVVDTRLSRLTGYAQFNKDDNYEFYLVNADDIHNPLALDFATTGNTAIELLARTEEYLSINFVKRAAPFIIEESKCELLPELEEALLEKAALTCLRKISEDHVSNAMLTHYKMIIEDCKSFLTNISASPRGHTVSGEERGTHTYTPGFTEIFW